MTGILEGWLAELTKALEKKSKKKVTTMYTCMYIYVKLQSCRYLSLGSNLSLSLLSFSLLSCPILSFILFPPPTSHTLFLFPHLITYMYVVKKENKHVVYDSPFYLLCKLSTFSHYNFLLLEKKFKMISAPLPICLSTRDLE